MVANLIKAEKIMPAFIIASVRVEDSVKFQAYASGINGLAEQFGGEYVVRGPVTEMLEGPAVAGERIVILRFPDAASARAYIASPTYQTATAHRLDAAHVSMRLIEC
jgi:uncharacterized protein (DUF1330 family)